MSYYSVSQFIDWYKTRNNQWYKLSSFFEKNELNIQCGCSTSPDLEDSVLLMLSFVCPLFPLGSCCLAFYAFCLCFYCLPDAYHGLVQAGAHSAFQSWFHSIGIDEGKERNQGGAALRCSWTSVTMQGPMPLGLEVSILAEPCKVG